MKGTFYVSKAATTNYIIENFGNKLAGIYEMEEGADCQTTPNTIFLFFKTGQDGNVNYNLLRITTNKFLSPMEYFTIDLTPSESNRVFANLENNEFSTYKIQLPEVPIESLGVYEK